MKPWAQCDEPVVAFDLANLSALMTQISSVLCSSVGYVDRRSVPHKSICPPPTATLAASWEVAALEPSHRLLAQQNVAADDEVSSSRTVEHPNLSTARPNLLRTWGSSHQFRCSMTFCDCSLSTELTKPRKWCQPNFWDENAMLNCRDPGLCTSQVWQRVTMYYYCVVNSQCSNQRTGWKEYVNICRSRQARFQP